MTGTVFVGGGLAILSEQPRPKRPPVPAGSSRLDAEAHLRRVRLPRLHAVIVHLGRINVIVAIKLCFLSRTIVFLSCTSDNRDHIVQ